MALLLENKHDRVHGDESGTEIFEEGEWVRSSVGVLAVGGWGEWDVEVVGTEYAALGSDE